MSPAVDNATGLVDRCTGVAARLWPMSVPSFAPPGLRLWLAQLGHTAAFGSPLGSDTTTGCAWWDDDGARAAAVGEAVEWYAGSLVPAGLVRATAADLARGGEAHVDPADLVLYSAEQYAAPGFPFVPFTPDLPVRWVPGRAVADGTHRWVPASLAYLGYCTGPTATEPFTNLPVSAGIAAARQPEVARAAALREVVERDALDAAWTWGLPLDPLVVPDWFSTALGADSAEWSFHRLPTALDVPGVLAVVRDAASGVVGVGAAVRDEPVAAARKAAAEAVVSAASAIELDTPGSPSAARLTECGTLRPWRADRAYARSYRADGRDIVDIACHLQLYLDPVVQQQMDSRLADLSSDRSPVMLDELPTVADGDWGALLVAAGYDPVAVDVTTSDVAALGWTVTRVVIPGMRSTAPAALPWLGTAPSVPAGRRVDGPVHRGPVPHA